MKTEKESPEFNIKTVKSIIIAIILCVVLFFIMKFVSFFPKFYSEKIKGKEGSVTTITTSDLEKVIKKSQIYTAEYPYNGYTAVLDEDRNVKYYVAYEGTVKAGLDISKITVTEKNEETGVITIQLPEVQVEKPVVNAGTMEFIFKEDKYETETIAEEAYRNAEMDLINRVSTDLDIKASATASAKSAVKALVEPWINHTNGDKIYTINVLEYGEK